MRTAASRVPSARFNWALDLAPPVPIYARFAVATSTLWCFFDKELQTGPTVWSNWGLVANGRRWNPINPQATPDYVWFANHPGGFAIGNRLSYFATPPDLVGRNGTPVDPFIGFPVDVV